MRKKYLGAIFPPNGSIISSISPTKEPLDTLNVPKSYDLRNINGENFVTAVKFQKDCGSCIAFGAVSTVENTLMLQRNDPNLAIDLSEAHLFFCHGKDLVEIVQMDGG